MPSSSSASNDSSPFLGRVRAACRRKGYTYQTEKTYLRWIVRYVKVRGTRHPRVFGKAEVRDDRSYLATERNVAASTQNQALNALLFLHRDVLGAEWDAVSDVDRAWRSGSPEPDRRPVVLTQAEVGGLLKTMEGPNGLVAHLLYGAGLRLSEALRLRMKDLDFEYEQITVRQSKGKKSADNAPRIARRSSPSATSKKQVRLGGGFGRRLRTGVNAEGTGAKVPERGNGMGMAICLSVAAAIRGAERSGAATAPRPLSKRR